MPRSIILSTVAVLLLACGRPARAVDLFVAPAGSGVACTQVAPCALESAQQRVRFFVRSQSDDIRVNLMDGDYAVTKPIRLSEADSGRNGFRVIYQALSGARPVLDGGVRITGWSLFDAAKNIWRADAPPGLNSRQFYINGLRADRPKTANVLSSGFEVGKRGYRLLHPVTGLPLDFSGFRNLQDAEVVRALNFQLSRCRLIGATSSELIVKQDCLLNSSKANLAIYLENVFELLRKPGEWYLDRTGAISGRPTVFYIPRNGEIMSNATGILGNANSLLVVSGSSKRSKVHDINIRGLTFAYATWHDDRGPVGAVGGYAGLQTGVYLLGFADFAKADLAPHPETIPQGAPVAGGFYDPVNLGYVDYIPASVLVNYAERISFEGDRFAHLGLTAIALLHGVQHAQIIDNEMYDIAATGIQLGGVEPQDRAPCSSDASCKESAATIDNLIANNLITRTGQDYSDTAAVFVGYARGTTIEHNYIADVPYTGIAVGWGWGWFDKGGPLDMHSTHTLLANNRIISNRIFDFNLKQRDGGGIYTLSAQPGSVIANNYIDAASNDYAGIYQDEGSSGFFVHDNVVTHVPYTLQINCGPHEVTSGNTYLDNFGDTGGINNTCARGRNSIEAVHLIAVRPFLESNFPEPVKARISSAGIVPSVQSSLMAWPNTTEFHGPSLMR